MITTHEVGPEWSDGQSVHLTRGFQAHGHGPVITRKWPAMQIRGWCHSCQHFIGPDRTPEGGVRSLMLVEDDAVAHYHALGFRCDRCEACVADGAIRIGEEARARAAADRRWRRWSSRP